MNERPVIFLTPAQVCERWRIDVRTLDKLALPWVRVSDRVRRISLTVVVEFEQRQHLVDLPDNKNHH